MTLFIYGLRGYTAPSGATTGTGTVGTLLDSSDSFTRTDQFLDIDFATRTTTYTYLNVGNAYSFGLNTGFAGVFSQPTSTGTRTVLISTSALPDRQAITLRSDPGNAFLDDLAPVCFAPGTRILTTRGEVPVEELQAGDLVHTTWPSVQARPVVWIGQQRHRIANPTHRPVRIAAGALGAGQPHQDLVVSPGHALAIDGWLVRAELLVNGASITRDEGVEEITWYHVELDAHAILFAEGVPAESYLDTGNRHLFGLDSLAPPDGLSPGERYRAGACLPVLEDGPALAEIQRRLRQRAVQSFGLALSPDPVPMLALPCGTLLQPWPDGSFVLPARSWEEAGALRLLSRTGYPTAVLPGSADPRCLGLGLSALVLEQGARRRRLAADAPAFAMVRGLYAAERVGEEAFRWTTGEARLPAALLAGFDPEAPLRLTPHYAMLLPEYDALSGTTDPRRTEFGLAA